MYQEKAGLNGAKREMGSCASVYCDAVDQDQDQDEVDSIDLFDPFPVHTAPLSLTYTRCDPEPKVIHVKAKPSRIEHQRNLSNITEELTPTPTAGHTKDAPGQT